MKKVSLTVVAAMALFIPALPASSIASHVDRQSLPQDVRSAKVGVANCSKKACDVKVTCPPEGGGDEYEPDGVTEPPNSAPYKFQALGPDPCWFEFSLFGKGLLGQILPFVQTDFAHDPSEPADVAKIQPGTTMKTRWPTTSFGRKSIVRNLQLGKRKFKATWQMMAFFPRGYLIAPGTPDEQLQLDLYYGNREGQTKIILRGKAPRK